MTSNAPAATGFRARLQRLIPVSAREAYYRFASAAVMFLFAFGLLSTSAVTLWIQLVGATVTLLFAALYATTPFRLALYAILAPVGAVLLYYGFTTDETWALIVAAVAQAFGITTAAAKATSVGRHARVE